MAGCMRRMDLLLLTPTQMAVADRANIAAGVTGTDLMDAAGKAVAHAVQRYWPKSSLLVLRGPLSSGSWLNRWAGVAGSTGVLVR